MLLRSDYFDSFTDEDLSSFLRLYAELEELVAGAKSPKIRAKCLLEKAELLRLLDFEAWVLEAYREAIGSAPGEPECQLSLANYYRNSGLFYSEKQTLEEILKNFGENREIKERCAELEERYPHLSVCAYIPCYNAKEHIIHSVESIFKQSYAFEEFFVIDDGSSDNSAELLGVYPLTILKHGENRGLAAARNSAIKRSSCELLASIDADVVAHPFWLERSVIAIRSAELAGVGGRVIEKHTLSTADKWRQRTMNMDRGERPIENAKLFGANTLFRRRDLVEIGGYNESLKRAAEDMDICERLFASGKSTLFVPEAICHHLRRDDKISVSDSCYNWRKPYFKFPGRNWLESGYSGEEDIFTNPEILITKAREEVSANRASLESLCREKNKGSYISFLTGIRAIFRDLSSRHGAEQREFSQQESSEAEEHTQNMLVGYIILVHTLANIPFAGEKLLQGSLKDIDDLLSTLPFFRGENCIEVARKAILTQARSGKNLGAVLKHFGPWNNLDPEYTTEVLALLKDFLELPQAHYEQIEKSFIQIEGEKSDEFQRTSRVSSPWKKGANPQKLSQLFEELAGTEADSLAIETENRPHPREILLGLRLEERLGKNSVHFLYGREKRGLYGREKRGTYNQSGILEEIAKQVEERGEGDKTP